jgi:protein SCO1/2
MIARVAALLALAIMLAGAVPSRAADIGGPFALVDHHGNSVTEASYPGKHFLIFLGYTYCPDVCPTELLVLG